MKIILLSASILILPITSTAAPARLLGPEQAADAAVSILQGDPYGKTKKQVTSGIKSQILIIKGNNPCSGAAVSAPVWAFRVEAIDLNSGDASGPQKINGFLTIDATNGKMTCASLPFLD